MKTRLPTVSLAVLAAAAAMSGATAAAQRSTSQLPPLIAPSLYGRDIYQFYCSSCHGREGRGDGPVGAALKTPPSDLTKIAFKNGGVFPTKDVEALVTNGRPEVVAHGSSDMPIWGYTFRGLETDDALVKVRLENVVKYLESIQMK